jgi:class 3 adenylate cyclase
MSMDAADHTFLFADIVGFTAFTERVGDEAAADVAVAFQSAAVHIAAELGCEVVKRLGDAVMVRGCDAARVLAFALRLSREMVHEGWCPPLRIGLHSGAAVARDGDWYGSTVNVAARLADAATAGEILMSLETRDRVAAGAGIEIAERGSQNLRNVGSPLAVFVAA